MGAKAPDPACAISATTLHVWNLPTDALVQVTPTLYPLGGGTLYPTGEFSVPYADAAAYVWTRGHGPSLVKAGAGLNDYHVIAMCSA